MKGKHVIDTLKCVSVASLFELDFTSVSIFNIYKTQRKPTHAAETTQMNEKLVK